MAKSKVTGLFAILATVLVWGISFINIKIAVAVIGPMMLGLMRFSIALVLLFFMKRYMEPGARLDRKDLPRIVVSGFVGFTLFFFFENNGIKLISPNSASIIVGTVPIAVILTEALSTRTPVSGRILFCGLLSLAGIALVTGISVGGGDNPAGYWMMGGAVVAWAVYCLVSKQLFARYSSLSITFYQTVAGTVLFVPFVFFETTRWEAVDGVVLLNVAILGVLASAIGYYLYMLAMDRLGLSVSALYLNLVPIVTLAAGVVILSEPVTWAQGAGAALVIAAVVLANGEGGHA